MSHQLAEQQSSQWVYTTIRVYDAERILEPTHVSTNQLIFHTPPHLTTTQVRIVIRNGDDELQSLVEVLPHDSSATEIPIRLLTTDKNPTPSD